ncbi:hypothetical protein [Streptomyces sp. CB03234]|uniref:hypothetical protein n=1 Tax=Streptomyces sp. (strain CB03234) TaxID=1703937 RepID=UPI001F52726D|nr:hypothetical protein [Streptomyces sp. CB03234]
MVAAGDAGGVHDGRLFLGDERLDDLGVGQGALDPFGEAVGGLGTLFTVEAL